MLPLRPLFSTRAPAGEAHLLGGGHVEEGEARAACEEVHRLEAVLVLHAVHHLRLDHRVPPHQPLAQLALLRDLYIYKLYINMLNRN